MFMNMFEELNACTSIKSKINESKSPWYQFGKG